MSEQVEPKTTTNQNEETKPRYEPPKLILLNEITLGQGVCLGGSGDADACTSGTSGLNNTTCNHGLNPTNLP